MFFATYVNQRINYECYKSIGQSSKCMNHKTFSGSIFTNPLNACFFNQLISASKKTPFYLSTTKKQSTRHKKEQDTNHNSIPCILLLGIVFYRKEHYSLNIFRINMLKLYKSACRYRKENMIKTFRGQ